MCEKYFPFFGVSKGNFPKLKKLCRWNGLLLRFLFISLTFDVMLICFDGKIIIKFVVLLGKMFYIFSFKFSTNFLQTKQKVECLIFRWISIEVASRKDVFYL
jgi:hypothetical protein